MLKPWKYDLIEQYFAAEISDEDLKKFQKLSNTDPHFLQEVQKYASQAALLEDLIEENQIQDESRQHLKTLFQQTAIPKPSIQKLKSSRSSFFLRIAASLAILILFSWLFYVISVVQPKKDLANQQENSVDTPEIIEENTREELNTQALDRKDEDEGVSQEPISQNIPEEMPKDNTQQPTQIISIDSTNYYPNSNLESQMLAVLDSRAGSVTSQILPLNNQHLGSQIHFKWALDNTSEITLEVFNNQKELVFEQEFEEPSQGYIWNATSQANGLYYWRLLGDEDILFMGRFYLRTNK